jgi:hypothetical protein
VIEHCGGVGPLQNKRRGIKSTVLRNDDVGGTPGMAHTLSGSRSGLTALRREQLQSNHREERKARLITDITSISLGKEEMTVLL